MGILDEKAYEQRKRLIANAIATFKQTSKKSLLTYCLLTFLILNAVSNVFTNRASHAPIQTMIDDVVQRPIRIEDRTSFAQMGMRAKLYIDFLKSGKAKSKEFTRYEEAIWDFVPRITNLRESRLRRTSLSKDRKSRGIVMTAGRDNFEYANHFIATVREVFHSKLPIEVYYYGQEDMPDSMANFLESSYKDVDVIDLSKRQNPFNESVAKLDGGGWAMKPFALLTSSFDEAMLVDADTVLVMPPEDIFKSEGYRKTGTLFFQDRLAQCTGEENVPHEMHKFLKDQFGVDGPPASIKHELFWQKSCHHYQESGLLLVNLNKPEVFGSLLLTSWMNTRKVRETHTYQQFHGEKESFWLAFELTHQPYSFNKQYGGTIGAEYSPHVDGFCSDHLLHFISDIQEHSIASKFHRRDAAVQSFGIPTGRPAWINGSLRRNKLRLSKEMLYPAESIWAVDGWWEWMAEEQTFCLRNYTRQPLSSYGLQDTLTKLVSVAGIAEKKAEMADLE
ncbi:uncharacterized protein FA14DRAFT_186668 [Meira miltonrushii]|uniref:Nucleotide-diphospho-sugar transferase n=1 Tax=Meira miltonrushii TaxID=1280837 RepID=A0A316VFY3_9BASI|nr:uncharacterized protein FA14DRAFT_186668 [Meira miltonrushii]PWN36436.1 hypothetical protein FA14DRAFT_186668 [Meira miltonrushii]